MTMSNPNLLKRLKQKFTHKEDYDIGPGAQAKCSMNNPTTSKNVCLNGYLKIHPGQDSLSDTETLSPNNRAKCRLRVNGPALPSSSDNSPASRHRASVKAKPTSSIVATSTTKVIQPPAYACCVNRVKIIDNCCGRTEHNIIYHQHHPIVGSAGDLAIGVAERTVVDITDSALVCKSSTAPRLKSKTHPRKCCSCVKQRQLQTLPLHPRKHVERKCIECEKEKAREKMKEACNNKPNPDAVCTCGLSDLQDNMKNKVLEKANSADDILCSSSCSKDNVYTQNTSMAKEKNNVRKEISVAHMLLDEPGYICTQQPKLESVSDDMSQQGNSSSGYCTQSDDCTDASSSIVSVQGDASSKLSADILSAEFFDETKKEQLESFLSGQQQEQVRNGAQPPTTLTLREELDLLGSEDMTPPPIPERNYRTNSFYQKQQLDDITKDDKDSKEVETAILVSFDDEVIHMKEQVKKVSPPLLTRRTEWPAPPPPLDGAMDAVEVKEDTPKESLNEPIHMTLDELWQDAKTHGIPMQKPSQCDRTYSTPEYPDMHEDIERSTSVPQSSTTPTCLEPTICESTKQSTSYDDNSTVGNMSSTTCECENLCMIDGPVLNMPEQPSSTSPISISEAPSTSSPNESELQDTPPMLPPKRRHKALTSTSFSSDPISGNNSTFGRDLMTLDAARNCIPYEGKNGVFLYSIVMTNAVSCKP